MNINIESEIIKVIDIEIKGLSLLRDVLNKMEKLNLISSVILWMQMRDVRNRIEHDYLPEVVEEIYRSITGEFSTELSNLKKKKMRF